MARKNRVRLLSDGRLAQPDVDPPHPNPKQSDGEEPAKRKRKTPVYMDVFEFVRVGDEIFAVTSEFDQLIATFHGSPCKLNINSCVPVGQTIAQVFDFVSSAVSAKIAERGSTRPNPNQKDETHGN